MLKQLLSFLFIIAASLNSFSQDQCSPVGWATQNGGTTGGGNAAPVTVSTLATLQSQASSAGAKVIYVSGTMGAGVGTRVSVAANKTIIGLPGAKLFGGFDVKANNIIIRNMIVQGPGSVDVNGVDCISIDGASNVWIDHCDIYDGQDGNMDIVNGANYVAVTWCKFSYTAASSNHQFCNLLGNSDSKTSDRGKLKITMMYNWWTAGCKERMPRVRFGQVHVVNNYFNCTGNSHCVRAGVEANLLVEGNYFDAVKTPVDLYQNNFTAVTSRNNTYISTTGNTAGSGTAFTPPYALTMTASANVKSLVSNTSCGAGATMANPTTCSCGSTPVTYTLTTGSSPAAGGSVTGAGTYNSGSTVTLTATAASGYTFTGWSGDASGTAASTTVTMNGNKSVTANFPAAAVSYTLTTAASPAAGGTVSGAGTYSAGTVVTVTATPAAGYTFTGWSGAITGTANPATVTMSSNRAVTANFLLSGGGGTSTIRIEDNATPATGLSGTYSAGTVVTVTATPAAGYTFTGWSGAITGTVNPATVTMSSNRSVTAGFQLSGGGGTSTIRIEDNATTATGLCLYEGAVSSNSGANNTRVINLTNSTGKGVNWRVTAPAAGTYTLNWRYANSSTSNTYSMKLIVNGVTINAALPFPKTSGSSIFANTMASVNFAAGNNDIRLESIASNATADIDWIEITGNSPAAGNCTTAARPANPVVTAAENAVQKIGLYPNPATGVVQIGFVAEQTGNFCISMISATGAVIAVPYNKIFTKGYHQVTYDVTGKAPGIYQVVISSNQQAKKIYRLLVK